MEKCFRHLLGEEEQAFRSFGVRKAFEREDGEGFTA